MSDKYQHKVIVIIFLLLMCSKQLLIAQTNPYLSLSYKDSLYADEKSLFVYNHITILNTYNQPLGFTCSIDAPEGWRLLSLNNLYIELAAGESFPLSVTLNRLKIAEAEWKDVRIMIWLKNSPDTSFYHFFVKASVINNFRAGMLVKEITVTKEMKRIGLPIRILNSGNVQQSYQLNFYNELLHINDNIKLSLMPGKDTIYKHVVRLGDKSVKHLMNEDIFLNITGPNKKTAFYTYNLLGLSSYRKVHQSAYNTFPAVIEIGFLTNNNKISGYFGVNSSYIFKNDDKLLVDYHSKQFGISGLQRDVFNVIYFHKRWAVYIGRVNDLGTFYSNGNGIKLKYERDEFNDFSVYVTNSNFALFRALNLGISVNYKKKKTLFYHELINNQDYNKHENAWVQNNKIVFANNRKVLFDINGGIGLIHNTRGDLHAEPTIFSYSLGYHFRDSLFKKWLLRSSVQFNSDAFPGAFQGYRLQAHELQWHPVKSFTLGAIYTYSFFKQSFFRDSIFYRSQLLSDTKQYGLSMGLGLKFMNLTLSGGKMTNARHQQFYATPVYRYGSAGLGFTFFRTFSFSFTSTVGYQPDYGTLKQKILLYTNSGILYSKWGGVQLLIDQIPVLNNVNNNSVFSYYEKLRNIGPFINVNFFRQQAQLRLQYNNSNTMPDNVTRENATASLSYTSKSDLRINLTVSTAINSAYNYKFGLLTLSKHINIVKPHSRKYYTLNMVIFEDANNNAVKEKNEQSLKNVEVWINGQPYISNDKGIIQIKNTDRGEYELDFHSMHNLNGLIPSNGFKQHILLERTISSNIGFKKGRIIQGAVIVTPDSASNQKFSADFLKVTVTDSSGEKFSTLTNKEGKFSIAVPAGIYFVSLNPAAFDEIFKPVQMAFTVDLVNNDYSNVYFEIKQKQRKIIKIKAGIDKQ